MTTDELQVLVTTLGLQNRVKREEVVIATCVFCGNEKWNLELSAEKGVYHCWACRAGGRLDALLTQLTGKSYQLQVQARDKKKAVAPPPGAVDFLTKPVAEIPSALHYLARRHVTMDVATAYGLRVCTQVGHLLEGRLVIPVRDFWTSEMLGWIGRTYTGGHPKYLSSIGRKVVFGWRQRSKEEPVVLVEGAFDGIAVHRAGYHAAVLGGTGGSGVVELVARLPEGALVVIMLDGDAVTQATRLYWQAKQVHEKVEWVVLPVGTDPADLAPDQVREYVERVR